MLIPVTVHYYDPNNDSEGSYVTSVNARVSDADIRKYFVQPLNIGKNGDDYEVQGTRVEIER